MSVFDLFRGFFGVPGGHYHGDSRREPLFSLEDEDEDEDAGLGCDDWFHSGEELIDEPFRFGFSVGPGGMRFHEPPAFGQMFRQMEEILDSLGTFGQGFPSIEAPFQEGIEGSRSRGAEGGVGGSGNSLRDFMLKVPDHSPRSPSSVEPRDENSSPEVPGIPRSPFQHWSPFFRFSDIWSYGPRQRGEEKKEDGDLDSQVSSDGLDQILTPVPSRPKAHGQKSFFQSVTVTKVVKPDGSIEERRTVRDGEGNEETTVTRSGGPGSQVDHQPFSNMQDELSMFTKFFGGFKG